jgi:cytidyltransferase-like protein
MAKVLVFGVFDGIHNGHRDLFRQARLHGNYVVVAVAPDNIVQQLKHRLPKLKLAERIEGIAHEPCVDEAVAGDELLGSYNVIKSHCPDIVALGYDQKELREDLEERKEDFDFEFEVVMLEPYRADEFHSSLLDENAKRLE